nr:MAG TPA_asm: hypothetical protein [Bacteriophage sp.]
MIRYMTLLIATPYLTNRKMSIYNSYRCVYKISNLITLFTLVLYK